LLAGQIDAPINQGNSGGPVIAQQKIVGIVMQGFNPDSAESIGYFIPPAIIAHVLKDSEDGKNNGFPTLDFTVQHLKSPTAKLYYGLDSKQEGVLVTRIFPNTEVSKFLKKNDVLLKIDKYSIASDGSVDYTPTLRADFEHALNLHHVGDKVALTYVRNGKTYRNSFTAQRHPKWHRLIAPYMFEILPRYYIYGGLVFVPVTDDLLLELGVKGLPFDRYETPDKRELIALISVLSADVNFGYEDFDGGWLVDFVNGVPIRDFTQFIQLLEQNKAKHLVFENNSGVQIIIDHAKALKSEAEIFENYNIPARYSKGLLQK
jgi:hypothetical protein